MFSETLYYILEKDIARYSGREAKEKLIGLVKRRLLSVNEVRVGFHEALDALNPVTGSIADAALIKAVEEQRLLTLVTCDSRLAGAARRIPGTSAVTLYELLSLVGGLELEELAPPALGPARLLPRRREQAVEQSA